MGDVFNGSLMIDPLNTSLRACLGWGLLPFLGLGHTDHVILLKDPQMSFFLYPNA